MPATRNTVTALFLSAKTFIDENPEAVRRFLAAWEEAVQLINANPEKYSALMVERATSSAAVGRQLLRAHFCTSRGAYSSPMGRCHPLGQRKRVWKPGQASYENSITD